MNKFALLTGSSVLALSLANGTAFAQQAAAPQTVVAQNAQTAANEVSETVEVSASRISIAGYTAPTPVSVIDSNSLQQAANNDIGETLRQLPMMGSSQSPIAATEGNAGNAGATGISSINLRNLGVTRTLVLIDGDREVWAGVQYGVDLNTIPSIMIQRVDVVTGGASAAWGSDAVAGVVNLIIDKNFTGLKGTVDTQDNNYDSRRQYGFTVANGFNFDNDRGHIQMAWTYADAPNTTYTGQLHWFDNPALVANPLYSATNTGVPQLIHAQNVGNSSPPGGVITATTPNSGTSTALNNIQFGPGGTISNFTAPNCLYYANSNLPPYISTTTAKTNTSCVNGSTNQANSPSQIGLASYPLLTETGFFYGSYKIAPNVVASAMLNYSSVNATGSSLTIQTNAVINSGNPFIPASIQALMNPGGATVGGIKSITVTSVGTASTKGGFIQDTPGLGPEQFENSVGTPEEYTTREFYRGDFKLDGTIGNDWAWNVSYQHSESHLHEHYNSIEIVANFANAVNAVTVTSAQAASSGLPVGSIACASTIINPTNGCVPYDPFGLNVVSPGAVGYVVDHNDFYFLNMEEDTAHAGMQGVLPWNVTGAGAPAVSFGFDYRKETMVSRADPYGSQGALGGGNFVPISAEYNILEGYGEIDLPLIKNGIVESLDGNMAGRITDYSTSGMVETWKLGLTSQVNDDFRLRGTWSFDIRAPDLAELFNDIPASGGQVDYKFVNGAQPTEAVALSEAAGNPNLKPETATTYSAGIVLTPHWVPGLTMSFDAYSIHVSNIVVTPSATFARNACTSGTPTPNGTPSVQGTGGPGTNTGQTGYCADWVYNPALVNSSNVNGLQFVYTYPFNNGYLQTSGIDFNADYAMDFLNGNMVWHLLGNYTDEETETEFGVVAANGQQAKFDFAGSLSGASLFSGVPKWHFNLSDTYSQGPWSGTVQTRFIGPGRLSDGWTTGVQVDNNSVPAVAYVDLRGTYNWSGNLQLYASIDNVFDVPPPNVNSYSVSNNGLSTVNSTIYDVLGRMYHAGLRFNY